MRKIIPVLLFALLPNISFANERFIPVELWSGGEITGAQEITFPETDFNFGYKERHSIRGPINWENPRNGENTTRRRARRRDADLGRPPCRRSAV